MSQSYRIQRSSIQLLLVMGTLNLYCEERKRGLLLLLLLGSSLELLVNYHNSPLPTLLLLLYMNMLCDLLSNLLELLVRRSSNLLELLVHAAAAAALFVITSAFGV